jgi:hypothetical protein
MALNFPSSPTIGQIYTDSVSGFSYEWDGTVWKSFGIPSNGSLSVINLSASGVVTSTSYIVSGGTSSQFLKGDGSLDSSSYIVSTGTSSQFLKADGSVDSTDYASTGKSIVMSIIFGG